MRRRYANAIAAAVSLSSFALVAASPSPAPLPTHTSSRTADVPPRPTARDSRRSFVPRTPSTPQHTEFVVEVNRRGQVVKVDSGKQSQDPAFNAITYGNVLQAFIRKPDGSAISGLYRLSYDYDPADKRVRRDVALVRPGGVNPNALGAVDQELQKLAAEKARHRFDAHPTPSPLPDLKAITGHRH
jgi:hypothetical protein